MRALSIKQPWASLIATGVKDIENRTWKTNFRGRIYIHASASKIKIPISSLLSDEQYNEVPDWIVDVDYPYSAIIGEVDIIDCIINHPSIWAEKSFIHQSNENSSFIEDEDSIIYNWVLSNPVVYEEPILNVKGKLSFWEFEKSKNL